MTWRLIMCALGALLLVFQVQDGNALGAALLGVGLGANIIIAIVNIIDRRQEADA